MVSVQEHPSKVFDISEAKRAHLQDDCTDMLLGHPDEYEAHGAQLLDGHLAEGSHSSFASGTRNFPARIYQYCLHRNPAHFNEMMVSW